MLGRLLVSLCALSFGATHANWQQQVDYQIGATVDVKEHKVTAKATITYHNHSPQQLDKLIFEFPQQRFANSAESLLAIHHITRHGTPMSYQLNNTYLTVWLDKPIETNESADIEIGWQLSLIRRDADSRPRSGYEQFQQGQILAFAQWYPRALGFDDNYQWDTLPFLGKGEFHLELGNYDVHITVPESYSVLATGQLQNPEQVLSHQQLQRWQLPQWQPVTMPMNKENNAANAPFKTWHFVAQQVRDFSFSAATGVVWQRQTINAARGPININLQFPNNGRWLWNQYGLKSLAHSIQYLDSSLAPFPFHEFNLVNVTGIGMEYPGIVWVGFRGPDNANFDGPNNHTRSQLYDVIGGTIHEVAHSYFPMLVNSNERREGFLDEGLASYLSYLIEQAWSSDFQSFYGAPDAAEPVMAAKGYQAPAELADNLSDKLASHYHIPATAWNILDQQILPRGKLLSYLSLFIAENAHRRVYFNQLVTFLERQANLPLQPYFNAWFLQGAKADFAITDVDADSNQITVGNLGILPLPVDLAITLASGQVIWHTVTYQQWLATSEQTVTLLIDETQPIQQIVIDPNRLTVDIDRNNNSWRRD